MSRRISIFFMTALAAVVIAVVGLAAAAAVVGEHVVCTPTHTIADNGTTLEVVGGDCVTATDQTVPGPTTTVDHTTTVVTTEPGPTTTVTTRVGTTTSPPPPPPPPPPNNCTASLSPGSGDIIDSFVNNSANGSVLCLHAGDYGSPSVETFLTRSGTSSQPITVKNYPGETATIKGRIWISSSYLTLSGFRIDHFNTVGGIGGDCGTYGGAFGIDGSNVTVDHNEIFQSQRTFSSKNVSFNLYINGSNETISHNKIHDAGGCRQSDGGHDHGVYVGHGSGNRVFQNWIWNMAYGWGVQVFPDASGSRVFSNVIDAATSGVVECSSGSDNQFYNNVVTNSVGNPQFNNGGSGPGSLISGCMINGATKSVTNNDQFNNPAGFGNCNSSSPGLTCSGNISIDPVYADRTNHDYRVLAPPLAGFGFWDGT